MTSASYWLQPAHLALRRLPHLRSPAQATPAGFGRKYNTAKTKQNRITIGSAQVVDMHRPRAGA
jgi:hypothetical protein